MTDQPETGEGFMTPSVRHANARAQRACSSPPILQTCLPDGTAWMTCHRGRGGYLVRFQGLVDFEITGSGTDVTVHTVPGTTPETAEHLYRNQALPLALSLQMVLVLHGSAVEIGSGAVAFIGASGKGKSTLAASFSSNGYRFLSDDGLLIDRSSTGFVIRPSHASLRLWDDSLDALADRTEKTAPPISYSPKARILAGEKFAFCPDPRALHRVFFLGDGNATSVSIAPVSSQNAVVHMLRHCFLLGVDERELLAHNFRQLAELSRLPIYFTLDYPRRYDVLTGVREAVIGHCRLET
jgi:hypothetical protein